MTEEVELLDAEPRRRSGLGSSPLSLAPVEPKRGILGALREHDDWVAEHGRELRVVFRAPAEVAPVEPVRAEAPAPVVEYVEPPEVVADAAETVEEEVFVEAAPSAPAMAIAPEPVAPITVSGLLGQASGAAPSTSDLLARLKAMQVDG